MGFSCCATLRATIGEGFAAAGAAILTVTDCCVGLICGAVGSAAFRSMATLVGSIK